MTVSNTNRTIVRAVAALLAAAVALIVIGVKKHGGRKAFSAAALVITLGFFAAMAALSISAPAVWERLSCSRLS